MTLNFLSAVLATKEQTVLNDVKEKLPILTSQTNELKYEVISFIQDNLFTEIIYNKFSRRVTNLNNNFEQLIELVKEFPQHELDTLNFHTDMNEIESSLKLVKDLIDIHLILEKQNEERGKNYLESMKSITTISVLSLPSDLQKIITEQKQLAITCLRLEIMSKWSEVIEIDRTVEDNFDILIMRINDSFTDLDQLLQVMYYDHHLRAYLNDFATVLLKEILILIINKTVVIQEYLCEKNNCELLELKVQKKSDRMNFQDVFSNILVVIDFLCARVNYNVTDKLFFLTYVGDQIRRDFCKELSTNCLSHIVIDDYEKIAEKIKSLQQTLIGWTFFKDSTEFSSYTDDYDALRANKICEMYKNEAETILKKDLIDMVQVGIDDTELSLEKQINSLQKCCITKSCFEFLKLAMTVLDKVRNSNGILFEKLSYTLVLLFEMYQETITIYHKNHLKTNAQQVALCHNNCMYICHEVTTNELYCMEKTSKEAIEIFDYPIITLQAIGINIIKTFIELKKEEIENVLSGGLNLLNVRECIRKLKMLQMSWENVLSSKIYGESVGELLTYFIDRLIENVLEFENISVDFIHMLSEMLNDVRNFGMRLFTDLDITKYTKNWRKFSELLQLLKLSLPLICNKWDKGNGPLASEFNAEEVRKLICALFKDTEKRSMILLQIV